MRHVLATLVVVSSVVPVWADEKAKANTLTLKEIADGRILLFDGETTFGWGANKNLTVRGGVLIYDGSDHDILASTTTAFRRYELSLEYLIEKSAKDAAPVIWKPSASAEIAHPLPNYKGWASAHFEVKDSGISGSTSPIIESRESVVVDVERQGFSVISKLKLFTMPQTLGFSVPKGNKLSLRNIKLKPFGTKPLFNSKDLTGWKKYEEEPKRAKSQFSVNEEGWLSIKNGPGDLQSTGQWADFVLQFDCRTNGDNLNSGVFFRCIPGEYQNGYEAQIQNQKAKEPKTYTIEEYDPETHKLTAKKKIENWSQDYGTGAVYRRIPARRAVARDREWFTMTVVAHGKHIATWVNGIQVVDWTDNRPENDNPRNGCRLKKGPISLQGHDPTTDLSFRNLRIADLEAKD